MASGNVHHLQQAVHHVFLVVLVVILAQFQRKQHVLATVSESNSAPDWNTMVTFLRMRRISGFGEIGDVFVGHDHAARCPASENP